MTQHEKKFLVTGLTLGLMLALVAYAAMRLQYPDRSAAQSQEAPILKYEAAPEQATSQRTEQMQANASVSSIQLDQKEQTDIGVETVEVRRRNLQRALMAVAKVDEPETQLASISARIGGRIDKLYLDFTGQQVRRGQTIASLYSPEVFSAAEEYRLALENRKRLGTGAEPLAVSGAEDLVTASRRRLELWGLTPQQLDEIASSAKPQIELPIYSTVSGIVTDRKVTQGQYVNAGEVLFTVTDLSTIWVKADVYQPDLPSVHTGQSVEITSDSLPGTTLHGRVGFLDTSISPQTRTASARIQVPNPSMRLRPGMFVQVKFAAPAGHDVLAVPRSAVLDTGMRKFVYVAKGNGEFEGRQVQLGPAGTDYYPVLAGLKEGERIVSQGSFLIDSQTRITGGMTGMFGGSKEFDHAQFDHAQFDHAQFDHAQIEHGQAGQGQAQVPAVPQIKFTFRSDPGTPRGNSDAKLHVIVLDASGKPVTDVQVNVMLIMPAMPAMSMGEVRAASDLTWKGSDYVGAIKVPTAGSWNVEVNASRNGQLLGSYHARLNAQ
jgi:Cu(I)/Ag(I) efflux system membrane fusion protein